MNIRLSIEGFTLEHLHELQDYITMHQVQGIKCRIPLDEERPGELGGPEYKSILELVLGASATSVVVRGMFLVIKSYFEVKKAEIESNKQVAIESGKGRLFKLTSGNTTIETYISETGDIKDLQSILDKVLPDEK